VTVRSATGEPLAAAAFNDRSQIVGRVWSFDPAETIDATFVARRVERATALRAPLSARTDAMRLVFGESDGLPGVVVDRYGGVAVVQLNTAGAERWRDAIADAVAVLPGVVTVVERSEGDSREREGLLPAVGILRGAAPPELVEVHETAPDCRGRWAFAVDVAHGHKTGFYLDQRDNRQVVARLTAEAGGAARVLDVFAYTGGFSVAARWAGASAVQAVDSSGPALALARENVLRTGLAAIDTVEADAFTHLRSLRDRAARFDVVVLDPPKLAPTAAQLQRATRAYKDVNLLGIKLVEAGGHLVTFSCSGAMTEDLFQKVLFGAALDAGREVQIVGRLTQPEDHPVLLTFPEAAYLTGLVCRVL
jgi:23S rRNA (cytosine1962-C5)-methyltransferase